jgi:hypothetical protein
LGLGDLSTSTNSFGINMRLTLKTPKVKILSLLEIGLGADFGAAVRPSSD